MAQTIQFRRDTAANWASVNPILADGELGFESNTGLYKIGNGAAAYNTLQYATGSNGIFESSLMNAIAEPGAAPTGKMRLYAKTISGRMMPKFVGPSGLDSALQPFIARNKVGIWLPPGNATTVPGVLGFSAFTAVGTATLRNVAATNLFTRMRRLGFVGAATAGSAAAARVAVAQITVGNGSGLGGFHKIIRWGISDAALVSNARTFNGISAATTAPTNVEPSTLTNIIGMGHGAADTTMKIFYGGSVAQPPIDLGANFPANTTNTDAYELALFSPPSVDGTVYYEVTRLNTGHVAIGTLSGNPGTALPANTTLLTYSQIWRFNNTTAAACGLDIMSDYIETDY
jgi:hypothetical protein